MEEALQAVGQAGLDFALVNLELPGPNGIEVARALRRLCPACRIVVMSVMDSEALRLAAVEAGATAFVSKRELTTRLPPLFSRLLLPKEVRAVVSPPARPARCHRAAAPARR